MIGRPVRPPFLICDSDATIQLLLTREVRPLTLLRQQFGIQAVVVPEVYVELQSNRKYGPRVSHQLRKAIGNGTFTELNQQRLETHFTQNAGGAANPKALAAGAVTAISTLGSTLQTWVDYGEAYSHAAGLTMNSPVLSHDLTALLALENAGQPIPSCVLRLFDLLVFARQANVLSDADCDSVRSTLLQEREYIPKEFRNCSFAAGLSSFVGRLQDSTKPRLGAPPPATPRSAFMQVLEL